MPPHSQSYSYYYTDVTLSPLQCRQYRIFFLHLKETCESWP